MLFPGRTALVALVALLALPVAGCGKKSSSSTPVAPVVAPADSLLTEGNLVKALSALRQKAGSSARASTVKIDPLTVTATLVRKNRFTFLTVDKSGRVQKSAAPAGATATFRLEKLDPTVPGRLLAELDKRYGKKLADIDAIVLLADPFSKKASWTIFVKGGKDGPYQADLDGSGLGTAAERAQKAASTAAPPSAGSSVVPQPGVPPNGPTGAPSKLPDIRKIQRCVQEANGQPKKIAACLKAAQRS